MRDSRRQLTNRLQLACVIEIRLERLAPGDVDDDAKVLRHPSDLDLVHRVQHGQLLAVLALKLLLRLGLGTGAPMRTDVADRVDTNVLLALDADHVLQGFIDPKHLLENRGQTTLARPQLFLDRLLGRDIAIHGHHFLGG